MLVEEYFINHVEIGFAYNASLFSLFSLNDKSSLAPFKANHILLLYCMNNLNLV